jgi:hypothetical protein
MKGSELFIKLPLKKLSTQVPLYGDIRPSGGRIRTKEHIPSSNDIFINFKDYNYLESMPHSDPNLIVVDEEVSQNIR